MNPMYGSPVSNLASQMVSGGGAPMGGDMAMGGMGEG
jgi:hypothetical protein